MIAKICVMFLSSQASSFTSSLVCFNCCACCFFLSRYCFCCNLLASNLSSGVLYFLLRPLLLFALDSAESLRMTGVSLNCLVSSWFVVISGYDKLSSKNTNNRFYSINLTSLLLDWFCWFIAFLVSLHHFMTCFMNLVVSCKFIE